MDLSTILSQITGPFGTLIVLALLAYGFFSGRLRPGKDYDDCKDEAKEVRAAYSTIVPALENFGKGSETVASVVKDLDAEIESQSRHQSERLDKLERKHAEQLESLKAHYKIEMDNLRSDVREVTRAIGDMHGDLRATQAAVERIDQRGSGPWRNQ